MLNKELKGRKYEKFNFYTLIQFLNIFNIAMSLTNFIWIELINLTPSKRRNFMPAQFVQFKKKNNFETDINRKLAERHLKSAINMYRVGSQFNRTLHFFRKMCMGTFNPITHREITRLGNPKNCIVTSIERLHFILFLWAGRKFPKISPFFPSSHQG